MATTTGSERLPSPAAALRRRFRAWLDARVPRTDTLLLTQGNVYILPTRPGLMFALTLLVLLLASINYQLNLGFVLTFLLAGSGLVSMHLTHANLRALTLHLKPPAPVHAGEPAVLEAVLTSPGAARHGLGLKLLDAADATLVWSDVPAGGQESTHIAFVPERRGRAAVPSISVETRFPLGLFRAWAVWRPAAELLVYPAPERTAPPLPAAQPVPGSAQSQRREGSGETDGVRGYRRGDPLKLVVWKKAASALATGGELVSRDTSAAVRLQLWLDWQQCGSLAPEQRLSRLAAWTLAARRAGLMHGLRLPGVEIAPGEGEAHSRRCLEALALWS